MPGCWFNYPWCSHGRAPLFFIESILNKNAFHSFDCGLYNSFCCRYGVFCSPLPSTNYMGFNVNSAMRGNFYLRTNSICPYSNSLSSNIIEGCGVHNDNNNNNKNIILIYLRLFFIIIIIIIIITIIAPVLTHTHSLSLRKSKCVCAYIYLLQKLQQIILQVECKYLHLTKQNERAP
jgi:hypothetical protein